MQKPLLCYQDPNEAYTLFANKGNYAWAYGLMQGIKHEIDGK